MDVKLNISVFTVCKIICRSVFIPALLIALYWTGLILYGTFKLSLGIFFIIFILLPLIFKYSLTLQRGILFLNFVQFPRNVDFTNPEKLGLFGTRNFYVTYKDFNKPGKHFKYIEGENSDEIDQTADNIALGVWHILPVSVAELYEQNRDTSSIILSESKSSDNSEDGYNDSLIGEIDTVDNYGVDNRSINKGNVHLVHSKDGFETFSNSSSKKEFFERSLKNGMPVVLYLHGNSGSRAAKHRVELYQVLRNLDYHVIAVDYRSYGDSCVVPPSEFGVVNDALAVYKWLCRQATGPIYVWGHSLGTGVSTHLLSLMHGEMIGPRGLVLESPFSNIREEVREHPFAKLFRYLPWFDALIAQPMHDNMLRFESDRHINNFKQPILILHAEDDLVVPFKLGYKLYRTAIDGRKKVWGPIEFQRFDGSCHYGHKYICRDPDLPNLIRKFFNNYRSVRY